MTDKTSPKAPSWDEIFVDPAKYGYVTCPHCNGYGSSLKEDADRCSRCGGHGLVRSEGSLSRNEG